MPIHDWTRVDARLYHSFHHSWMVSLSQRLNNAVLPEDYFALLETPKPRPSSEFEVLDLLESGDSGEEVRRVEITTAPRSQLIQRSEWGRYAGLVRITVRRRDGDVVSLVEIVSQVNKSSKHALQQFVQRSTDLIGQGVHRLLVDPFSPGPRDPKGLHQLIWQEFSDEEFTFPEDKSLTMAAYDAGFTRVAYVDFIAVGDPLPSLPLFLEPERYVPAPLEDTYQTAWKMFPKAMKGLLTEPPTK